MTYSAMKIAVGRGRGKGVIAKSIFSSLAVCGLIISCSGSDFTGTGTALSKKKNDDAKKSGKPADGGGIDTESPDAVGEDKEGRLDNATPDELGRKALVCEGPQLLARPGESVELKWTLPETGSAPEFSASAGGTVAGAGGVATFTAEATVAAEMLVTVTARLGSETADCKVKVLANNQIFTEDDGITQGLKGNVYQLPANTQRLPDLSAMTSLSTILAPNLDVPLRKWTSGFPGVLTLFEWFAIRFEGKLDIATAGTYYFRVTSDDGANLYLNDANVVDNDGLHSTRSREGSVTLTQGKQKFRVDYYQGPRDEIAFQIFWKKPGDTIFTLVPASVLGRP